MAVIERSCPILADESFMDFASANGGAHGQYAARQSLRQAHQIGYDISQLTGEHSAGASKTCKHFVRDQERAARVASFAQSAQEPARGHDATASAEDGLNQDRAAVRECTVVFTEPIPQLNCSYSDHFGINVKLQLRSQIKDGSEVTYSDERILSHAMFDTIEHISDRYIAREIRHSQYRNIHFILSVVVFIGLLIGQWWVEPIYGHFIILLGGVLLMVAGTINGLIGFIFGRWEIRALREFISEVRLARKVYLGDSPGR